MLFEPPVNVSASAGVELPAWFSTISRDVASDISWITNGPKVYRAVLGRLGSLFAWNDEDRVLTSVAALGFSAGLRRFESSLWFMRRHHEKLGRTMQDSFVRLPPDSRCRLVTAPMVAYRLARFCDEPSKTAALISHYLNAESAWSGAAASGKGYWTALGDAYCIGERPALIRRGLRWSADSCFAAPLLGSNVPVDFFSPNVETAKETTVPGHFQAFSPDEISNVWTRLQEAYAGVMEVNRNTAALISRFIRVIIPLKVPADEGGSTSDPHIPGMVLLRAVGDCTTADIANALVHEAIHQFLYLLETEGAFVVKEPDEPPRSPWSGRELPLHSFVHASFVWYGLANFWTLASDAPSTPFEGDRSRRLLKRSLAGYCEMNPVDILGRRAGMLRSDALESARELYERIGVILERWMPVLSVADECDRRQTKQTNAGQ